MTITNGYCTTADLRGLLSKDSAAQDSILDLFVNAASRMIDRHCGRPHGFWQDGSVATRDYHPDDTRTVYVDDISTSTGLVVKTDTAEDGTFATTLTITTDFLLYPRNSDKETPVRPWDVIRIATGSNNYFPVCRRPTVQVTAKFGWPAVPDDVKLATIYQAQMLYAAKDARTGINQDALAAGVGIYVSRRLHPQAELLLADYCREPR